MNPHVPAGTTDEAVDEVRQREAAHSRELAERGALKRLWRPPLAPGQWRTFGLFTAADADALETLLASMPLRIWRTDEVTPLSPHPNDPAVTKLGPGQEFLIAMTVAVPEGTPSNVVEDTLQREAQHARVLAERQHLLRLWGLRSEAGVTRTLGLWNASNGDELDGIVASL